MEVIFLIGAVQALFFSILIFNKKEKFTADKILGTWLALLGLHQLFPYLVYGANYEKLVHLGGTDTGLFLLHAVMLNMYVETVVSKKNLFDKKLLWNLIPVAVCYTLFIPYYFKSAEDKIAVYNGEAELPVFIIFSAFILMTVFVYFSVKSLSLLNRHKKNVKKEFSYSESVDLGWLRNLIYSLLFIGVTSILLVVMLYFPGITTIYETDFIGYLMITFFIFALGFWGYKQGKIFSYKETHAPEEDSYKFYYNKKSNTNKLKQDSDLTLQTDKLKLFIITEKPYLEPKLSLYQLASLLGITSHQLSFILNNILKCNFFEFINYYRVEEVKKRLAKKENKNFTIFSIALECGFNSKASFNRIFKNITGKTPSEYQKSL